MIFLGVGGGGVPEVNMCYPALTRFRFRGRIPVIAERSDHLRRFFEFSFFAILFAICHSGGVEVGAAGIGAAGLAAGRRGLNDDWPIGRDTQTESTTRITDNWNIGSNRWRRRVE